MLELPLTTCFIHVFIVKIFIKFILLLFNFCFFVTFYNRFVLAILVYSLFF